MKQRPIKVWAFWAAPGMERQATDLNRAATSSVKLQSPRAAYLCSLKTFLFLRKLICCIEKEFWVLRWKVKEDELEPQLVW